MYPYLFIHGTNSGQKLYGGDERRIEVIRACAELRMSFNFPYSRNAPRLGRRCSLGISALVSTYDRIESK